MHRARDGRFFFLCGERLLPASLAWGLAAYLLATAQLLERRGPETFWRWDVRSFVYSVFPERGELHTSGVFRLVRHPVESTMVRWALALGLAGNDAAASTRAVASLGPPDPW